MRIYGGGGGYWVTEYSIGRYTEVPLASEPLKFVSSRMSHYACCPPLLGKVNDIFWPLNSLYWEAIGASGKTCTSKTWTRVSDNLPYGLGVRVAVRVRDIFNFNRSFGHRLDQMTDQN